MRVALTIAENKRHVALRDAESFGYLGLRQSSTQHSDFRDFFSAQKLLEMGDETRVDSVLLVESVVSPFEIGRKAVRLYTVDMVDHREIGRIGNEGRCHEAVDADCLSVPISPQTNLQVSVPEIDARLKNLAIASLRAVRTVASSIDTTYATKIADLIEVNDCNRSPFFRESDIHVTGCPSGNGGSTIKDPSHASTFGGSAIMASASGNYNGRLRFL